VSNTLLDAAAESVDHEEIPRVNVKRLLFDWSSVVAIAIAAMTWATLSSDVRANAREIERLRARDDARAIADVAIAANMATKLDVQRVSDQVTALAAQIRSGAVR
jgi:hypothetical protein